MFITSVKILYFDGQLHLNKSSFAKREHLGHFMVLGYVGMQSIYFAIFKDELTFSRHLLYCLYYGHFLKF